MSDRRSTPRGLATQPQSASCMSTSFPPLNGYRFAKLIIFLTRHGRKVAVEAVLADAERRRRHVAEFIRAGLFARFSWSNGSKFTDTTVERLLRLRFFSFIRPGKRLPQRSASAPST